MAQDEAKVDYCVLCLSAHESVLWKFRGRHDQCDCQPPLKCPMGVWLCQVGGAPSWPVPVSHNLVLRVQITQMVLPIQEFQFSLLCLHPFSLRQQGFRFCLEELNSLDHIILSLGFSAFSSDLLCIIYLHIS